MCDAEDKRACGPTQGSGSEGAEVRRSEAVVLCLRGSGSRPKFVDMFCFLNSSDVVRSAGPR
eukprot:4114345-Pyramimonas_sp.AAC.1